MAHIVGPPQPSMAWAGGKLWLGDDFGVSELDPSTGAPISRIDFPMASVEAMPGAEVLVAASYIEESIAVLDPETGELSSTTAVPCPGDFAVVGQDEVWVTSPCINSVARVALGDGATETVQVSSPGTIAVGGGAVWVTGDGTVVRIDSTTLEKRHVLPPALGSPTDIQYLDEPAGSEGLWVTSFIELFATSSARGSLARIDPETLEAESIDAGSTALLRPPESLILHGGDLWIVGVDAGPLFEAPRVLMRFDLERKAVVDQFIVKPGSVALIGGEDPDAIWLGAPIDELYGVRATPSDLPQPPTSASNIGGMSVRTVEYAAGLPDHVYLPNARPPDDSPSLPTFVLVGGGEVPPSEAHHMATLATGLAAEGAVVHVIGYRSAGTNQGMAETIEDIRCGVAYARSTAAEFGGGEQVILIGFSYGGDAVVSTVMSVGPMNFECEAMGGGVPDGVVALDGFPAAPGDAGQDVPMLFVGAGSGGNGALAEQVAVRMRDQGYDVEAVQFPLEHVQVTDPSPSIGVLDAILDFVRGLGE